MSKNVKEFHIRDLVIDDEYDTIESDHTIQEAAQKMRDEAIPDLVVLEKVTHKVLGVIADFDIVENIVAEGKDPKVEKVTSAMYVIEPVTLDTPVTEAYKRMQELKVNLVPVVENGKLKGVASQQDCWSYIPNENPDEIGYIPVENPRFAEFWLGSIAAILAFILGVLLPMAGILPFFTGEPADLSGFFGAIQIRGDTIRFYAFEAHGSEFFRDYFSLVSRAGVIWVFVILFGILNIIVGTIGAFSLFYASYSDLRGIKTSKTVRDVLPWAAIITIILQWIIFGIALRNQPVVVNGLGLAGMIIASAMIAIAIKRDYLFKQIEKVNE
jgi:CBS domain-containing protein